MNASQSEQQSQRGSIIPKATIMNPDDDDETTLELEKASLLGPTQDSKDRKATRCSRFWRWCAYLAIAIASWMTLRLFVRTTVKLLLRLAPEVDKEHPMPHRTAAEVQDVYAQYRDTQRMGTSDDYVEINTYDDKHLKRVEAMRQLDTVRFEQCGGFERVRAAHQDQIERSMIGGTNWMLHNGQDHLTSEHCTSGLEYKSRGCKRLEMKRFVCEAPHPVRKEVTVTIERIGPFAGTGGYDWSVPQELLDVGMLKDRMNGKNWTLVGGMVAPITPNGTIIGYPPIHIHHAHIFPIGNAKERGKKIHGSFGDHHDVVWQAHGDSQCLEEEGGVACLLKELDEGHGFVVQNSTSGISANFELNDVRPKGSPPMEYWFEITMLHTPKAPETKRSTFIGLNSPCIGHGPCTYPYPMDPNNNAMWFQYVHGDRLSDLANGTMGNFVLHTHQTIFDSAFLIKTSNDDIFNAFERFRGKQRLPMILDCHDGGMDLEVAKAELLSIVNRHKGQVVCEATKPSLVFVEGGNGEIHAHDKRSKLNCLKEPVSLNQGDRLVALAFNTVHENKYTRQSKAFKEQNVFSDVYSVYQHTIFRFDLSYDTDVAYAPPSFFAYAQNGMSYYEMLFFNANKITATCPSTVQFRMRSEWISFLSWLFGI